MKQLKSSIDNLRQVYNHSITVRYIAEPFVSFDAHTDCREVLAFMKYKDFDVVGAKQNGAVVGYVQRADLQHVRNGALDNDIIRPFDEGLVLEDWKPMMPVLELLAASPQVFIVFLGEVSGIITKGDLQKAPVRMWLFGVLSLLEMQFLRLIRAAYPQDTWNVLLSEQRIAKAKQILKERKVRNEAIDLADCLQFADKREIVIKSDGLRQGLGFSSRNSGQKLLKELEHLRDELAHAQDFIAGRWPKVATLAKEAENLLAKCEALDLQPAD